MEALSKKCTLAFSLIELMIIIIIVALLIGAAIKLYEHHVISSHVAALLPLADKAKSDVETAHNEGAIFGASSNHTYIASTAHNKPFALHSLTQVAYGCVDIAVDVTALGLKSTPGHNTLTMTLCPSENEGAIKWTCGYDHLSYTGYLNYLPSNCQTVNTSIHDMSF